MLRRTLLACLGTIRLAAEAVHSVRGRLIPGEPGGRRPALRMETGSVDLTGDAPTLGLIFDARLKDADFEANGRFLSDSAFEIDPIHKRNLFVYRDGRRLMVSYWCPVCSIRTWSPGKCMCCQEETELDLKEKFE